MARLEFGLFDQVADAVRAQVADELGSLRTQARRWGIKAWRAELGPAAVAGPFLGRAGWQRLSETWADPDLSDPELCFEIADCLATYINTLQPLRTERWP